MRRQRFLTGTAALLAIVAATAWFAWPASLGGRTTYVTTHGVSMEPRFSTGDLAVIHPSDDYQVGDVAAYRSRTLGSLVLHRIVAIHDGRYTFKGDNNTWLDPEHPTRDALVGELAVRVPAGGVWLDRLTSPAALGLLAFLLLAGGGGVAGTRRKRRRGTVSRHAAPPARRRTTRRALAPQLPAQLRVAAATTAVVGLAGAGLAAVAWAGPLDTVSTVSTKQTRSMTFDYTAHVSRSAAYDGTTVTSPDPVFRRQARAVDVGYSYRGVPGRIVVAAELSAPSGWHATVPLAAPVTFTTATYDGHVRLDLDAFDRRAHAAAAATGIPIPQLAVDVVATVRTAGQPAFAPALPLMLTPLQLTVTGGADALRASDVTALTHPTTVARTLTVSGQAVAVATARRAALAAVLLALLAATGIAVLARRSRRDGEAAEIRRRYAALLVPVAPIATAAGRPVVDVTEFRTLARLAEHYGLLVLHWTRSGVHTFVVQDESTTYRYRTGSVDDAPPVPAPRSADPAVTDGPGLIPAAWSES